MTFQQIKLRKIVSPTPTLVSHSDCESKSVSILDTPRPFYAYDYMQMSNNTSTFITHANVEMKSLYCCGNAAIVVVTSGEKIIYSNFNEKIDNLLCALRLE